MLRILAFIGLALACTALVVIAMGICAGFYLLIDCIGPANGLIALGLATAGACALIAWDVRKAVLTPDEPHAFR